MAYTFIEELITTKNPNYKRKTPYTMKPTSITVHNTANDAPAVNENKYMLSNDKYVSYHTAIDDKEVRQAIPYNRTAYHAGDGANGPGNRTSISIEVCYSKSGGKRYEEAEENTVIYIATLLHEFGWGVDRVKQHYHWSRKNCPHRIRGEKRWDSFIKRIEAELNKLKGFSASIKPSQPEPTPIEKPEQPKDYSNRIGRIQVEGETVWRMQTNAFTDLAVRDVAKERLLQGLWNYAESKTYSDGTRIQSGAYYIEKGWTYEEVEQIAKFVIDNGIANYITIRGYK